MTSSNMALMVVGKSNPPQYSVTRIAQSHRSGRDVDLIVQIVAQSAPLSAVDNRRSRAVHPSVWI